MLCWTWRRRHHHPVGQALKAVTLGALLAVAAPARAADPVFDAKGFSPNREFASDLAFEHIDPLTGNVLLTFTDLVLPGNAGFDLRIQRTYNIKIYSSYISSDPGGATGTATVGDNDAAGLGWTMHFGKVRILTGGAPPVIEMPDGSSHPTFLHMNTAVAGAYITRDLWTLVLEGSPCNIDNPIPTDRCPLLRLANGLRYVFGHRGLPAGQFHTTDILDPFGNRVRVTYEDDQVTGRTYVQSVEQRLKRPSGTEDRRSVTFRYCPPSGGAGCLPLSGGAPVKRLAGMQYGSRTWAYNYEATGSGHTLLRSVNPPENDPDWTFEYYGNAWPSPYLMKKVTTPHGGTLSYVYQAQKFFYGSAFVFSPALRTRTTGGAAGTDIVAGTWTYRFSQGAFGWNEPVVVTVTEGSDTNPCRTTVFETWSLGLQGDSMPWRVGALKTKTTSGAGVIQIESYNWVASMPISQTAEGASPQTHLPLLASRTIERGTSTSKTTHTTTHTYHQSAYNFNSARNFNDYGHPETTVESGGPSQLTRTTGRVFFHPSATDLSLGNYIAGNVESETVTVAGESFTRAYGYDTDGFMKSQDLHGIITSFTKDAGGNLASRVDGINPAGDYHNRPTFFTWHWGVPETMRTPIYTITRVVADDSTIQSQTRRRFTTKFSYDGLLRPTLLDPPEGDSTTWTYAADGRTVTEQRGTVLPSRTISTLDGFGRVSSTGDSQGVLTDTNYDRCGRTVYQSFPYKPTAYPNIGTTLEYDALDRLTFKRNPGASFVSYGYASNSSGTTVTITDEESHATQQLWKAFGDPSDARLMSVTDAEDKTTTYSYNALGSLASVLPAAGGGRTWTYDTKGLLREETHPENGTVVYTYRPNGLLDTRTDPEFGLTRFAYDDNKRLRGINRPGGHPHTTIAYDESDNRTFLQQGSITSVLDPYDGNNRLKKRVDTIALRPFITRFDYDARDNLQQITYPSTGRAVYTHDTENRISRVTNGDGVAFADRFEYHPSGGALRYFSGNGVENRVCYDGSRYWMAGTGSGAFGQPNICTGDTRAFLQLGYGHDRVGNVDATSHMRRHHASQALIYNYSYSYTYDRVDRLKTATTSSGQAWGNLTFDYDPIGNRQFKEIGGLRTTYGYNPSTNRLLSATTGPTVEPFGYDDNGNTTSDSIGTYEYNADDMLAKATAGSQETTYGYDGDKLRKLKKSGAASTYYVHGLGNQLLSEIARAGTGPVTFKRDYVYAGSRLVAAVRPPTLLVSPETLIFAGVAGSASPPTQAFTVSEASGGSLSWQATETVPWLAISPAGGPTTPASATVAVNTSGLEVGTYLGTINVESPGAAGSPRQVTVRLVVTNEAGLVVQPGSLGFDMTEGQENPEPQDLFAVVSGGPDVPWSATTSHSWITASPSSGSTPSRFVVSVDGSGKRSGTHRGWIKVAAGATPGSPRYIPIELVVRPGAGAACADTSWFCETFDDKLDGDLGGQGYWEDGDFNAQVVSDPRGFGKVAQLDPPPGEFKAGDFAPFSGDPPVEGSEISVHVMTAGVAADTKQVGKIEFFTIEGQAWGKTTRTFAALRFGASLTLQYGPNIYQVLVDRMEPGRWYDVRVAFQSQNIFAYVDGVLLYQASSSLANGMPVQAFAMTAWDYPGAAYVDSIDGHGSPSGLVVNPLTLGFRGRAGGLAARMAPAPATKPQAARTSSKGPVAGTRDKAAVARAMGALPLSFEANQGQADSAVRYLARAGGYNVFLTEGAVVLAKGKSAGAQGGAVTMRFTGASPDGRMVPVDELPGKSHYYIGNDPSRWRTNVPHYAKVRYEGIHPGVDAVFYGSSRQLEYDLLVAPGVDPSTIKVAFEGAEELRLEDGHLVLRTAVGEMRQLKPTVYQEVGGVRHLVDAEYVLDGRAVGFRVANYDRSHPLVVDPVLVYATYLGGSGDELSFGGARIVVDEEGSVYATGTTGSLDDFPILNAWQPAVSDLAGDAFVTRFTPDGSSLIFSTYFGGPAGPGYPYPDLGLAIALDPRGNVYVAGETNSREFPQLAAFQEGFGGGGIDGFVAKFSPTGELLISSYLGGGSVDGVWGIAIDRSGAVYVTGRTQSSSMRWTPASPPKGVNRDMGMGPSVDVFVARVMGGPTYLTYLNGSGQENPYGMAVDHGGNAYVVGVTNSPAPPNPERNPFPASPQAYQRQQRGFNDTFVTRLDPSGQNVVYSTYLGGIAQDEGYGIALSPGCAWGCEAFVAGLTNSPDFPVTPGGMGYEGHVSDVFLTKVASDGASLVYSTSLAGGGSNPHRSWGGVVTVDTAGSAYVAGTSSSTSFPEDACPQALILSPRTGPYHDAYFVKVAPSGTAFEACALIGGEGTDVADAVALDIFGDVYLGGWTYTGFPTTEGAFQRQPGGDSDAFVLKMSDVTTGRRMQFASGAYRALEGDGDAVVTVTRRGNLDEASSVYYRTSPGTAIPAEDYQHREGRLTFGQGESALAFTVPVVGDSAVENDETVNLTLSDPAGGDLGFPAQAVLTIGEDDGLTRTIVISERGSPTGPPGWRILHDVPWLSFDRTEGTSGAKVHVTANPFGLAPGSYTGTIIVEADAPDSPQFVLVTLTVTPRRPLGGGF